MGKYFVDKISVQFCQQQVNKCFDGYVKYANFMGMTKTILDYAINQRYIKDNPMKKVIEPRRKAVIDEEENKERNFYNEKITPHGFRHTHCSLLFETGATIKEVQERLGHEDIKTTMNIYAHVSEQAKEETVQKFAQYMNF